MHKTLSKSFVGTIKQLKDGYSILGKTLSGIVRLEADNNSSTVFASFINFKALTSGEYVLFLVNSKKQIKEISLGKRPISITKTLEDFYCLEQGFLACVCVIDQNVPLLIASLVTENNFLSILDLKKLVYEKYLSIAKTIIKESQSCDKKTQETVLLPSTEIAYNDEIVATENYYVKGYNEKVGGYENEDGRNEDGNAYGTSETKKETTKTHIVIDQNENVNCKKESTSENANQNGEYYKKAKRSLEELFLKFPKEERLCKIFADSNFVKIFYEQEKYYVVGLTKENGKEKYICYGVPGEYSKNQPKELKGYCVFVPESVFDVTGKGYWMMFQDAISGKCVKKEV